MRLPLWWLLTAALLLARVGQADDPNEQKDGDDAYEKQRQEAFGGSVNYTDTSEKCKLADGSSVPTRIEYDMTLINPNDALKYYFPQQSCIMSETGSANGLNMSTGRCPRKKPYSMFMCSEDTVDKLTCCCNNAICQNIIGGIKSNDGLELIKQSNQIDTYNKTNAETKCLHGMWKYKENSNESMWGDSGNLQAASKSCAADEICVIRAFYNELKFEFGCFPIIGSRSTFECIKKPLYNYDTNINMWMPHFQVTKRHVFYMGRTTLIDQFCCFGEQCNLHIFVNNIVPRISKNAKEVQETHNHDNFETATTTESPIKGVEEYYNDKYTVDYDFDEWIRQNIGGYIFLFLGVYFVFVVWFYRKTDPDVRRGIREAHEEFDRMVAAGYFD